MTRIPNSVGADLILIEIQRQIFRVSEERIKCEMFQKRDSVLNFNDPKDEMYRELHFDDEY